MRKLCIFFVAILFLSIGISCKKVSSTSAGDVQNVPLTGYAQFHYLNYLYNQQNGQALNNEIMNVDDEYFQKYKGDIQKILNQLLKFPIQTNSVASRNNSLKNVYMMLAQASFTNPVISKIFAEALNSFGILANTTTTNTGDLMWYETVPSDIQSLVSETSNIASAVNEYLTSDKGINFVNDVISTLETKLQNLIDYALDGLEDRFGDELTAATIGICAMGGAAIASLFINPAITSGILNSLPAMGASIAGLFVNISYFKKIMEALDRIQKQLNQIEAKIDIINRKIDILTQQNVDIILTFANQGVLDAKNKLDTIVSNIVALKTMPEEIPALIKEFFTNNVTTYNEIMQKAVSSAEALQQKIREQYDMGLKILNTDETQQSYKIKRYGTVETYSSVRLFILTGYKKYIKIGCQYKTINIKLPEARYFAVKNLQNIELLKRLSLTRIQYLSKAYTGTELLKWRKKVALMDLPYVEKIKQDLKDFVSRIANYIYKKNMLAEFNKTSISGKEIIALFGSSPDMLSFIHKNGDGHIRDPKITKVVLVNETSGTETEYEVDQDTANINAGLRQMIFDYLITNENFNKYIQLLWASVLEWEANVKVHISAGQVAG